MGDRIGILGATGWLGQALGLGLLRAGVAPGDLVLLNRSGSAGAYAAHPGVTWVRDAGEMLGLCDTVVLSVRPEDFPPEGFAPRGHLLVSFMAAWTFARLREVAPKARLVRAMPNGGAATGTSYTPWVAPDLSDADAAPTRRLLTAFGTEDRVETEDQLDILSALSGSGPGYPALLARGLLAVAAEFGLPQAVAERAVASVVAGSAGQLAGGDPQAIIDALKSYRGITAAGLAAAEAAGFEAAIATAIRAAVARARAMGRRSRPDPCEQ